MPKSDKPRLITQERDRVGAKDASVPRCGWYYAKGSSDGASR
jgi:hypothetical protein